MNRLIFIDDDQTELDGLGNIVKGRFAYVPVHWPEDSVMLSSDLSPDIIVSDLYLPSFVGDREPTVAEREAAARESGQVSEMFAELYSDRSINDKSRLRNTMTAISKAYGLLEKQWSSMGQSPSNGIELMATLRRRFPQAPFIFYSRKMNPEDVIRVLDAGADDAIRKGALSDEAFVRRIEAAIKKSAEPDKPANIAARESASPAGTHFSRPENGVLPEIGGKWATFAGKVVGVGAAVFGLLLARAKFLDWVHKGGTGVAPRVPTSTPIDAVALVLCWYLLVWLLLISGDAAYRMFTEIWKGILWLVRRIPAVQSVRESTLKALGDSVPRVFHTAWDVCVIIMAVLPALRYAAQLLPH